MNRETGSGKYSFTYRLCGALHNLYDAGVPFTIETLKGRIDTISRNITKDGTKIAVRFKSIGPAVSITLNHGREITLDSPKKYKESAHERGIMSKLRVLPLDAPGPAHAWIESESPPPSLSKQEEEIAALVATEDTNEEDQLACFNCMNLLEKYNFTDAHMQRERRRNGPKMKTRVCIPCFFTDELPEGRGPAKGIPFNVRSHAFVKCCECLAFERYDDSFSGHGKICKRCVHRLKPRPLPVVLDEALQAADRLTQSPISAEIKAKLDKEYVKAYNEHQGTCCPP